MPRPAPNRSSGPAPRATAPEQPAPPPATSQHQLGEAITLRQAAAFIARSTGCRKPHLNTVFRWATKGVAGQRLHTFRVGRIHWTTRRDVADFLRRLNEPAPSPASAEVVRRQEADHARQITAALAAELRIPIEEFA
jgi:hypothetical protein